MMLKFFEDMDNLVIKFSHWLKVGGKVAFVIGNKKISDSIIPTDKIITEIFEANGFTYISEIAHKLKTNNFYKKKFKIVYTPIFKSGHSDLFIELKIKDFK